MDSNLEFKVNEAIECNTVVNEFDYNGLLMEKPKIVKNGAFNASVGSWIFDVIEAVSKAIVLSQITSAVDSWIHPAEYNYGKEILTKLNEIEANLQKLTEITKLATYQGVINERRKVLVGLNTISASYYLEYCQKALEKPKGTSDTEYEELLTSLVMDWSTKICDGTNVYFVVENLLKLYLNDNVVLGKNYPEIYDEIAYASYPWESKSYGFKKTLRDEDMYVILSNVVLTTAYYIIKLKESDVTAKYHLEQLRNLVAKYIPFAKNNDAELNSNPVCQIPGAELTFRKDWQKIRWTDRLMYSKNGKKNIKESSVRNHIYYENNQGIYPTAANLQAMFNYYKQSKSLSEIFTDANLYNSNNVLLSGFNSIPSGDIWVVVQGRYEWNRTWRKNRDTFYTQMIPIFSKSLTNYIDTKTPATTKCNIKSGICPPMDYDPPYYISNTGNEEHSCGIFPISGRK